MSKAREILSRSKVIGKIRSLTRTMELVATSRFKSVHDHVVSARPYTDCMTLLVGSILARCESDEIHHPLLENPPAKLKTDALIVLTSNRGLCGSYNSLVLDMATERMRHLRLAGYKTRLTVIGRSGVRYLRRHGYDIEAESDRFDGFPNYAEVSAIADGLISWFLGGEIGGIEIVYTQFASGAAHKPAIAKILPMSELKAPSKYIPTAGEQAGFEFWPSIEAILDRLLPATVRLRIYQCFLDAAVTEQLRRIAAMRSATDNADDMIRRLTVQYNRSRQGQVTTELTEIIGGRVGIK